MEGVGKPGRLPHRLEVAIVLAGDLAEEDSIGEGRKRPLAGPDHRLLSQGQRELARHHEADVDDAAVELRESALEVRALKGSAEEDAYRRQWIVRLEGPDLRRDRLLDGLRVAGGQAKPGAC